MISTYMIVWHTWLPNEHDCLMYIRGVQKNATVRYELADKLMGYNKKHQKSQIPTWPGSVPPRLKKYAKEILKNTKKKS